MAFRVKPSNSSTRRLWYGGYRIAYVTWRTLNHAAAAWHVAVATAVALACALALLWINARTGALPVSAYLAPLWLAGAYAVSITAVRVARNWRAFPAMRREMRKRHLAELRAGGLPRREFQRWTWVRVRLPFWVLTIAGSVLAAELFPRHDWRGIVLYMAIAVVALALSGRLEKWNERFRPPLAMLCPRCGYDLAASPGRCPECGMRRIATGLPVRTGHWAENEDDDQGAF
jgi:hypothetical protein